MLIVLIYLVKLIQVEHFLTTLQVFSNNNQLWVGPKKVEVLFL